MNFLKTEFKIIKMKIYNILLKDNEHILPYYENEITIPPDTKLQNIKIDK